jgi:carboxyl-terminal processing protease
VIPSASSRRDPRATRRSAAYICAAVLACVVPGSAHRSVAAQDVADWKREAIASFDEVWQTIADTFYDPTFGGLDWKGVRAELRPRVESASSADQARAVTSDLLARLKRSHFVVLSESSAADNGPIGEAAPPIDVRVTSGGLVITSVDAGSAAAGDGVRPGLLVMAIDGISTAEWKTPDGPDARSRALEIWRKANRALHGPSGTPVRLHVQATDGSARDITTARPMPETTVAIGNLPPLSVKVDAREVTSPAGRRVGVIRFNVWLPAIDGPIESAVDRFRRADGLVIDLRGNPGGLAVMISGISGHLMTDAGQLLGRMQTRQGTLEFHPNPRLSTSDGRRVAPFAGPVAILVDELTASTSECFAGGLQALGRARVFGRQTMGQALPALTKRLPNGDVLMYAVGDFVTGAGRSLEGQGVAPDEVVPLSRAALSSGGDPDLAAALRWVDR